MSPTRRTFRVASLQNLHEVGLNPFAILQVAESLLLHPNPIPVEFTLPVRRFEKWLGVVFRLEPIPAGVEPPATPDTPIPVEVARRVGVAFGRDMVVILAYEREHERTTVVTWGREPGDKEQAASIGIDCIELLDCDVTSGRTYEDFRREGETAKKVDQLSDACRAAYHALRSLLACREGISDLLIQDVVSALEAAIGSQNLAPLWLQPRGTDKTGGSNEKTPA